MKIIRALNDFPPQSTPIFLAAGCFDGLHLGHRAVLQVAIDQAQTCGGEAWVFTFDPHPAKVLSPTHAPPLICTPEQQIRQLQDMGIDGCILQPFTVDFMNQEPTIFFKNLCLHIPKLAGISVGKDWLFGKNRQGNSTLLAQLCSEKEIFFSALPAVCWSGQRISSTRIREAIRLGKLDDILKMLGRPMRTIGTVIHGKKIGRELGYPTANINPQNDLLPPPGIYAAELRVGCRRHKAAAYIGHCGTFHQNEPQVLEVHLLEETDIDLYGQSVEVSYLSYIRGDQVFDNSEKLKEQIKFDIADIRSFLKKRDTSQSAS